MQEGFAPADLALLPLGTLAHALTNDDALRWLEAAGNALRPGGLLVLELAHPADVFDGALVEVRSYPAGTLNISESHPGLWKKKKKMVTHRSSHLGLIR